MTYHSSCSWNGAQIARKNPISRLCH